MRLVTRESVGAWRKGSMDMGLWQKQGVVEVSRMKKGLKLSKARESTAGATKPHCKHTHIHT